MQLDHINIVSRDMDAMRDFLVEILDLKEGFRPPFDFPGYWLYLGDQPIIHLMQRDADNAPVSWVDHLAFGPFNFDEQCARLDKLGYSYHLAGIPGAGIRQIFVAGPDGAKLEMQCPA